MDDEDDFGKGKKKAKAKEKGKKRKGKRKRGEESDEDEERALSANSPTKPPLRQPLDRSVLSDSIFMNVLELPLPLDDDENRNIDLALLNQTVPPRPSLPIPNSSIPTPELTPPPTNIVDEAVSEVLAKEVTPFLHGAQGTRLAEALAEAEQRRLAQIGVVDELLGLNEDELDRFILTEDEVRIKERVWVELNKDYLEAIAGESIRGHYNLVATFYEIICILLLQSSIL